MERMKDIRNAYKILVKNPDKKDHLILQFHKRKFSELLAMCTAQIQDTTQNVVEV